MDRYWLSLMNGEAVLLGVDGRSDFNGLHSRKHNQKVEFYAFDILVSDGEDLRKLPLSMRKTNLSRLLARRVEGICLMGMEGMVSKHCESTNRGGRVPALDQGQEPAASRVQ